MEIIMYENIRNLLKSIYFIISLFLGNKKEIKISGEIIYNFLNKFDKIFNKFSNIGTQKILVRNVKL